MIGQRARRASRGGMTLQAIQDEIEEKLDRRAVIREEKASPVPARPRAPTCRKHNDATTREIQTSWTAVQAMQGEGGILMMHCAPVFASPHRVLEAACGDFCGAAAKCNEISVLDRILKVRFQGPRGLW